MNEALPLSELFRTETRALHERVEALPFFEALNGGTLPLARYVEYLKALRTIHAALEEILGRTKHDVLSAVWRKDMRKLPLLDADIEALQEHDSPAASEAGVQALVSCEQLRRREREAPASLLGYLYVFEGATLGGKVLKSRLAAAYKLQDDKGLAYFSCYGSAAKKQWVNVQTRLDALSLATEERNGAVAAACEAFAAIGAIATPLAESHRPQGNEILRVLNPQAGYHQVPQDLREIEAALRAGRITWDKFPYYEIRYGERGRLYTRSDSAWIAALATAEPAEVREQTAWLGRVLAARGMPRLLLEEHLMTLADELTSAVPEKKDAYEKVRAAARALREERTGALDDRALEKIEAEFAAALTPAWRKRLRHMGTILGAAVADERAGIVNAVGSIEIWLAEADRFPPEVVSIAQAAIQSARKRAR